MLTLKSEFVTIQSSSPPLCCVGLPVRMIELLATLSVFGARFMSPSARNVSLGWGRPWSATLAGSSPRSRVRS